jgi:hypothetical protein
VSSFGQIRVVIGQLPEKLDCQAVAEFEKRQAWIVMIDDDLSYQLVLDDKIGLLQVACTVAPLPEERRSELLTLLMQYNDQWVVTGGVRFALGEEGLSLVVSFPAANIEATWLAQRLMTLSGIVSAWRELLARDHRPAGAEVLAEQQSLSANILESENLIKA